MSRRHVEAVRGFLWRLKNWDLIVTYDVVFERKYESEDVDSYEVGKGIVMWWFYVRLQTISWTTNICTSRFVEKPDFDWEKRVSRSFFTDQVIDEM